jgi:hypothetical protein
MSDTVRRITTAQLMRALMPNNRPPMLQYGFLTTLYQAWPRPVTTEELIEYLWGDDPSGGPLNPCNSLSATACSLRRRGVPICHYRGFGWTLDLPIRPAQYPPAGRSIAHSTA